MVVLLFGPGLQGRRGALGRMMETVKHLFCLSKRPKDTQKWERQIPDTVKTKNSSFLIFLKNCDCLCLTRSPLKVQASFCKS